MYREGQDAAVSPGHHILSILCPSCSQASASKPLHGWPRVDWKCQECQIQAHFTPKACPYSNWKANNFPAMSRLWENGVQLSDQMDFARRGDKIVIALRKAHFKGYLS